MATRRTPSWTFLKIMLLIAVLGFVPSAAFAQATGTLAGVVTDQTGGVMPGVTVDVVNANTGQVRSATTNNEGYFAILLLNPGQYDVKATLQGFKVQLRKGVTVTLGDTARVDMKLTVGGQEEMITVAGEAALVETSHATMGITIDQRKVVELPLNGRNFTQLGTLIPGVVAPPSGLGGQNGDATPGGFGNSTGGFNVNGMRNQSNNFLLDGSANNDTFNTGFVMRPPPDAIQEFKIQTHSFAAEYGRNAGSVVNVATRSGTNTVAGSAWEFNRDDQFQARNYFVPTTQTKPVLKQNQYGGAIGGPVVKNKLFSFGYYEGYRNTKGNTSTINVLSDAQRAGVFATAIKDPLTGVAFPGNTIPANRISAAALKLLNQFMPHANVGTGQYFVAPETVDNRDSFGLRFDYQKSGSHSLLARYMRTNTHAVTPPTTQPIGTDAKATLQDFMASDTFVFTSHLINVARSSYNWISATPQKTSGLNNLDYGINVPNTNPLAQGLASIAISGFNGFGDSQQPFVKRENKVFQFSDDLTYTRGQHSMKFGADARREGMYIAFINRPNGDFTFNGVKTGSAAADFLLGLPSQFRRTTTNQAQDGWGWSYAAYLQDEWRQSAHLTLSVGVRYELAIPFQDRNNALNAFHTGQQSTVYPAAPAGLVYPGDLNTPSGTYNADKNNIAPRFNFVYDPKGEGRTTIRGAWGIFYDALAGQGDFFQNGVLAPPFTPLVEVNAPPASLTFENPLNAITGGATAFPSGLTVIGWGKEFKTPYAYHFNLTIQQQIGQNMGAEVGYVGSRGRNLPIFMEVNPGVYAAGQTTAGARIMPAFALVRPTFSAAKSQYDSLQASLRMRPTHGVNFLASYTLGHAQDHVSGLNIGGDPRPVMAVDMNNPSTIDQALTKEWADALFDARQRFVLSFGVALPDFSGSNKAVHYLLGGWQFNGIYQAQTGFPLSVTDSTLTITYLTNRPDATCNPNAAAPHSVDQWFDTSCFARRSGATTGDRVGNAGRNSIRGPGFQSTDLSLFKTIDTHGRQRLQLRVEGFNIFNNIRFNNPSGAIGTVNFGKVTSAADGRVMQFGIKYLF